MRRVHLLISGRVQGVCFRLETRYQAQILGLTGWVRNSYTGEVELEAEGDEKALREIVRWCHQGPPSANVKKVVIDWEDYQGNFNDFVIRV